MRTLREDFGKSAKLTDVTIHVQLKATTSIPSIREDGARSYFLKPIAEYDRLRRPSALPARLLAVLFLPEDSAEWLQASTDELVLKRAAYWTSLSGAPPSENSSGCTVYLPASQQLSPDGLRDLFRRFAHLEDLTYGL